MPLRPAPLMVCETFASLQGETTFAGLPCFFIRLAGCNLRCRYCDTAYAWEGGRPMLADEVVAASRASGLAAVTITGGEPLLQPGLPALAQALLDAGAAPLLIETNGSLDISLIPPPAIAIMDLKCPASGQADAMDWTNVSRLRPHDEVKFVIQDRADYDWARAVVARHDLAALCHAVLFSPAAPQLAAAELGRWVLADRLPVRLQIQLHKLLGLA